MPKIPKPSKQPKPLAGVRISSPISDRFVQFSFRYAQLPTPGKKFCIAECQNNYYLALLQRLNDVCKMPMMELQTKYNKVLRNHAIRFGNDESLTEEGFTCLPSTLRYEVESSAFQFSITTSDHGRIAGFIIQDVFYVVWYDHLHALDNGGR